MADVTVKKVGACSLLVGAIVVFASGCGSIADSIFGDGDEGDGTGAGNTSSGGGFGDGDGGVNNTGIGAGNVGHVDPSSACASSHGGAILQPISLVFMIDRSGSMEKDPDTNQSTLAVRWNPVKTGLTSFFGDPASTNVSASLAFFPIGSGDSPSCKASDYAKPIVAMTQLPNSAAFTSAFNQGPGGYTPTEAALQGAIDSAKLVKATGKNVAVVLATDGEPKGCSDTPEGVDKIAKAGADAQIKTYVIGVGPSTGNLNSFAQNGGTGKAIMIPTNNAAQVSADLIAAIGQIANALLGCNFGLPTPPAGQTLDVNAVNVNYTPPNGAAGTLAYSQDCSNAGGWHYDNTSAPKEIVLCGGACQTAQAQLGAKLDIIFGCATAVPPGGTDPTGKVH